MRVLLDEMISFRIARELRERGHDVLAIKGDRPDLEREPDRRIVEAMAVERRAVVTNDVKDYQPIHERRVARGEGHYGIVFSHDDFLPRDRRSASLWVRALDVFLRAHPAEDALRNRVHYLR